MVTYYDLNVQCFAKRSSKTPFADGNDPELLYVSHVRPKTNSHPRILHSHKHHAEILLICSGTSEFLIHDRKYPVGPGDIVIYNAGIVHDDLTGPETDIGYYCAAIGDLHMPGLPENALIREEAGYIFSAGGQFEVLQNLFAMMFHSLSTEEAGAEGFSKSLLRAVLVKVLTIVEESEGIVDPAPEDASILGNRVKAYIDDHYMEQLTLAQIGEAMNASPHYLSHVFKKMSGYSPIQYLLRRRIGEAQTLLISTDIPIVEIAGQVGFDTQNYFNAQFTRQVGMPPKKYRENYIVGRAEILRRRRRVKSPKGEASREIEN